MHKSLILSPESDLSARLLPSLASLGDCPAARVLKPPDFGRRVRFPLNPLPFQEIKITPRSSGCHQFAVPQGNACL